MEKAAATKDGRGWCPLQIASHKGNPIYVEAINVLLATNSSLIDVCNSNGWSSLYIASRNGHVEAMKVLLAAKASLHVTIALTIKPRYDLTKGKKIPAIVPPNNFVNEIANEINARAHSADEERL